jgi:hypothetical protein
VTAPWQLYVRLPGLAVGWAAMMSGAALNLIVAPWFERRRVCHQPRVLRGRHRRDRRRAGDRSPDQVTDRCSGQAVRCCWLARDGRRAGAARPRAARAQSGGAGAGADGGPSGSTGAGRTSTHPCPAAGSSSAPWRFWSVFAAVRPRADRADQASSSTRCPSSPPRLGRERRGGGRGALSVPRGGQPAVWIVGTVRGPREPARGRGRELPGPGRPALVLMLTAPAPAFLYVACRRVPGLGGGEHDEPASVIVPGGVPPEPSSGRVVSTIIAINQFTYSFGPGIPAGCATRPAATWRRSSRCLALQLAACGHPARGKAGGGSQSRGAGRLHRSASRCPPGRAPSGGAGL